MNKTNSIKIEDGVYTSQLPNGLTIVTHEMPIQSVAVGAWIKAGSRNETLAEHGIAHFLEHMAFKGTKNRSAKQIVEQVENVGGEMNASTGIEVTSYYFRLLKDDLRLGMEILADILQNPLFEIEEMDKEKDVILQEIAACEDDADDVIYDKLIEKAYDGQAIGRSILGTKRSVKALTREQLSNFLAKHYIAENMVIAMAGGADHQSMLKMADDLFGNMPKATVTELPKAVFSASEINIKKSLEQDYLVMGFESLHFNHPDYFAQQVLSQLFGGGMSSRLFQNIREEKGLCYAIYSGSWGFDDTGLMFAYAATGGENMDTIKQLIYDEIIKLVENISEQELIRACNQIKAAQMMSLESPVSRSEQIARQSIFYKHLLTIDVIIRKLDNITLADLSRVAHQIFIENAKTGDQFKLKPHMIVKLGA